MTSASAPTEYYASRAAVSHLHSSTSPSQPRTTAPISSSERRAIRNRMRNPNWIPRPRNAFIIFRCEFARLHARYAPGEPNQLITDKTLSKRAGDAWKLLPAAQKVVYKKRAEEEREEHARQYPTYRFNPARPTSRSRSDSSPAPPARVARSAQVASLVAKRERSAHVVESESTPKEDVQVSSIVGRRRPSSTPLPSAILPVDSVVGPGASTSYPNTPYLQTYRPAEGTFVSNVNLFDGYTFGSGSVAVSNLAKALS